MGLDARLSQRLAALHARGLQRSLPAVSKREGVTYEVAGRRVVGFCSNDYLGLAQARDDAPAPAGAASSRLICGDLSVHRQVERRLAALARAEDAVLFPSGFQLNVGVLPCILSPEDTAYSDALNHASLIDGLRLARAERYVLPHGSPPPHDAPLAPGGLRWWVSESIFSMDGDAADPRALQRALAHGLCVYLDDAHGFGLHAAGTGWAQAHDLVPTLYVGTLSKALGCAGAFVAGTATTCAWIRTRARSFVYSTGTSPRAAAAILSGLELLVGRRGDEARRRLSENLSHLAGALRLPAPPTSPIVPIVLGGNARAVSVAAALLERGYHVQAIRPPTVPMGSARLRLTLSAAHEPEQIDGLATALREVLGPAASLVPPPPTP